MAAHSGSFDLLLGRHTYDIWAGYWPTAKNGFADSINAATKYVVTHRPDSLGWGPFEGLPTPSDTERPPGAPGLGADMVEGVRGIKAKDGPDLILWGSSTLTSILLEHGLADEVMLLAYPVLLGKGKRFFSDRTPPCKLALTGTKAVSSGIIISTYTPDGPLQTGSYQN